MKIEYLPYPLKTYNEIKKMSKEESNIYEVEMMVNIALVYNR